MNTTTGTLELLDADLVKKSDTTTLNVIVCAPTLGWTNVLLDSLIYVKPPEDGIQEVILRGTPPCGIVPQVLERFDLSVELPSAPWLRGVRIVDENRKLLLVLRTPVREQPPVGNDFTAIESAGLKGDKLILDVRYGGGCLNHTFQLNWDGEILKSIPPQVVLELSHNANGDSCKALVSERLQFDLSVIIDDPRQYIIRVRTDVTEVIAYTPASPVQQQA
ncbi:MAG: hypothetical protein SD837_21355 [Candidatus Electrothrix scaldis]|nr:MAG: hypothetical protein SD837_21355 [Candidatus Electrothrix sp. GW3-3]